VDGGFGNTSFSKRKTAPAPKGSERIVIMEQKRWVRITVVFFAWMVVLTIFSRAAASAIKAKVTVTKPSKQTITHEVQLVGTVEAKDHFLQYVPAGLMIKSIKTSPGQSVESGDILFTVDTQKLEEKIGELETELANAKRKDDTLLSRAEKSYRNVEANAQEEKELAYRDYAKAVAAYNEYIDTHPSGTVEILDTATPENAAPDDSLYQESAAMELKNAMDAAQSAYEMAVREQNKLVKAAADSFQQAKEDISLEQDTEKLEENLEKLRPYLQNGGQYLAEHPGVVSKVFVESGKETVEGAAVLISNSSEGVRLIASFSEEYKEDITENSTITLRGENEAGGEESYVGTDVAIARGNSSELGVLEDYSLTLDIPGNLYPVGSSVSVTVSNQSGEYDTCIPLRSLRQNGNQQYFIYVLEEENTVLGKELAAKEMIVEVLDKNEQYAAIKGGLSFDQQVIVSASKDIIDGSRVKIIE